MRVITGKYKGRALVAPKDGTRPTLDRAKETLFNILNPLLQGAVVLDLFAGSGQLAIECLSRGSSRAIVCDNGFSARQAIKANFEKIGEKAEAYFCDYSECLRRIANVQLDLVLVDPPYKAGVYDEVMSQLVAQNVVKVGGVVVCEHSADDTLSDAIGFEKFDERKVGTVKFTFYKRV